MALQADLENAEFTRVVLEEYAEGVYVFIFRQGEEAPCFDYLQGDWEMAKRCARDICGTTEQMWRTIPDTGIMGQH